MFKHRWARGNDLPDIMAIDRTHRPDTMTEDEWLAFLRTSGPHIAMVAEDENGVAGFCVFACYKFHLEIVRMAAAPEQPEAWSVLARAAVERLTKDPTGRRFRVLDFVDEADRFHLEGLKAAGFEAINLLRKDGPNGRDLVVMAGYPTPTPQPEDEPCLLSSTSTPT
jgi:hypothetical protein